MSVAAIVVVVSMHRCCAVCDRVACRRRALRRSIAQPFCWRVRTATLLLYSGL
jgi:hypothetical protein